MVMERAALWGGGGGPRALGGTPHRACGGEMGSRSPPQAPILFLRDFSLVSWEFGVLLRPCSRLGPCDSLSALLTVPCCTIDHLHSSRP